MGIRIESIGISENKGKNPGLGTRDMIKKAGEECLSKSRYSREDIGVVINVSVYKDHDFAEPALATFVQNDLEINAHKENTKGPKTLSFDVLNGAMGFLNACQLVGAMVDSGKARAGLVVSGDMVDYAIHERGSSPGFYLSGAAMLLDSVPDGVGFKSFYFRKFVELQDKYESYIFYENKKLSMIFEKDPNLERIYLNSVIKGVTEFLATNASSIDSFDLIIPPQVSPGFVSSLTELLGVNPEKVVDVTKEEGDLFNASLPIAMARVLDNGMASPGQKALVINVASGVQVGIATYGF